MADAADPEEVPRSAGAIPIAASEQHREFVAVPVDVVSRAYQKALAEYRHGDNKGYEFDDWMETWAEFEALADYLPGQIADLKVDTLGDVERLVIENDMLREALRGLVNMADRVRQFATNSPLPLAEDRRT